MKSVDNKRPLKVFLCHASADKPAVRDLYKRLTADGVDAWLDVESLLPGQKWKIEIPKAIQNSDIILVCLSKESVNKEGFVQREIREALDVAKEKLDETIFIIPAKLEDCDVPARLDEYHWVNLYEEGGYKKLVGSLQSRAKTVDATLLPSEVSKIDEAKSNAIELEKEGKVRDALNAYYELKKLDPAYSGIDEKINQLKDKIDKEIKKEKVKPKKEIQTPKSLNRVVGISAFIVLALASIFGLPALIGEPETTPVSVSKTPTITITPTKNITLTPTPFNLTDEIDRLAYFEITDDKKCTLVFLDNAKEGIECPDQSPSLDRFFAWSKDNKFAFVTNVGYSQEVLWGFHNYTVQKNWVYILPTDRSNPFVFRYFEAPYWGGFSVDWFSNDVFFYRYSENGLSKLARVDTEDWGETVIAKTASGIGAYDVSPDLTQIAYTSQPGGKEDVFIADTQNYLSKNITDALDIEIGSDLYWLSNDILFLNSSNQDLYLYTVSEETVRNLGNGVFVSISPDRTKLLVFDNRLRLFDFTSETWHDFNSSDEYSIDVYNNSWSPDGNYFGMAYNKKIIVVDLNLQIIYVINSEFDDVKNLTWSNNNLLAFAASNNDVSGIYVTNLDGSQILKVSSENNSYAPAWIDSD